MKAATLSFASLLLIVAGFLAVAPIFTPANQNAQTRAAQNLVQSFTAPVAVDQSQQATQIVTGWVTANPRVVNPDQKYDVEGESSALMTASEILTLAIKKNGGGVDIRKLPVVGTLTAKLINTEGQTGKPPSQCRYEWKVTFSKKPGLEVYVCGDQLFQFVDLIRETGKLPPGLGT